MCQCDACAAAFGGTIASIFTSTTLPVPGSWRLAGDHVQHMLGHASLEQTSTYLNATLRGLHESMAYLHAAREQLATPLHPSVVETLEWLFPERKRLAEPGAAPADTRYLNTSSAFRTSRYRALYQQWLDDSRNTLWMAGSPIVADAIDRELGRVECVELSRQYLHLSPWLTSPDITSMRTTWGTTSEIEVVPPSASEKISRHQLTRVTDPRQHRR